MSIQGGPEVISDGLLLYLDAANPKSYPSSGSTWYDLNRTYNATKAGSQSPNYPALTGSGWFEFTGGIDGNNYSRFGVTSLPSLSAVTVIAAHYPTVAGGHVLRHSAEAFQLGPDGYCAGINFNDINTGGSVTSETNRWRHDSLTFDGTNLKAYKNGVLFSSRARGSSTTMSAGNLLIGTRNDVYSAHYVGYIAFVIIYNRILSGDEIAQNYNAVRSRFGR